MATPAELGAAFPGWVEPRDRAIKVAVDYGLDEPVLETCWHPDPTQATDPKVYLWDKLKPVVMANWWDHRTLAALYALVCGVGLADARTRMAKPALVAAPPPHEGEWLHRLPQDLQTRLAKADRPGLARWSEEWSRSEPQLRAPDVICEVLVEVAHLCREADALGKGVYYYTSL